jgi:hypothetical protein
MELDVKNFIENIEEEQTLLSYKGQISSEVVKKFLADTEDLVISNEEEKRLRKKVYNVVVEAVQNLFHHTEIITNNDVGDEFQNKYGIIKLNKHEEGYKIITANFVNEDIKRLLSEKIDKIKNLTKEELKEMYKFVLNHQKLSDKGGGGLGLLDIAKKTNSKIDYSFVHYKKNWFLYMLIIYIS